jgi:bile acid:Na+ symporter, BASS family
VNQTLRAITRIITNLFVLWVTLAAGLAFIWPEGFRWLAPYINLGLGAVMFGMGVTLTSSDFRRVIKTPYAVAVGVIAQFLIMPLIAAVLAKVLELPPPVAAGLILVGSCPGGTASNVMVYLARGDVALSVTLTSVSTMFSVIATPALMQWLAGQYLPVDAVAMLWSILMIIILPVGAGLAFHRIAGPRVKQVVDAMPILSVAVIVILVACVVALSRSQIASSGGMTVVAVMLHNGLGLAVGYGIAKLAGLDPVRRRAISLEVGMQNAGLAVVLAVTHFAGQPLVSLPAAIFGVWASISGPALASYWSSRLVNTNAATAVSSA